MTMKVSLYKDGQLKSVTDTWKWDMPKRHSERKIYQMKSHNISNEKDWSNFYFFFSKERSLYETHYLGGGLTQ
jgi:hypothetical protein